MIWNAIIGGIFGLLEALFGWLPVVTIEDLYYFGPGIHSNLITVIQHWNAFMETFPYAETAWTITLWIIIPTELTILGFKIFLGQRVPVNSR